MHLALCTVLFILALSRAIPTAEPETTRTWDDHEVHEKRDGEPIAWTRTARAEGNYLVPLRVGLKQRNLEHADRWLSEISDPSSPTYAQHWTAEQVANAFAPPEEAVQQTVKWLEDHGVARHRIGYSRGRNWVELNSSVWEVERLLKTEYHIFQQDGSEGGFRIACDSYSLPKKIRKHIDFVMPTIQLDGLRPTTKQRSRLSHMPAKSRRATSSVASPAGTLDGCADLITIDCLRALYNFGKGNYSLGTMGILEESNYLNYSDLRIFFRNYTNPQIPLNTVPEFVSIDGGRTINGSVIPRDDESDLDFQSAYSIVWPQKLRLYQVGDGVNVDGGGTFNIFLDALDASYCTYMGGDDLYIDPQYPDSNYDGYVGLLQCGGAPLSEVISMSYGQIEAALPAFYQRRQCYEWMKLGLQGVSVLIGSGDHGVANSAGTEFAEVTCVNAKHGYLDVNGTQFSPSFPGNCPYVTAVGATQLKNSHVSDGEVAAYQPGPGIDSSFFSGGGFSNVFARPAYQKGPVTDYLANYAPAYGLKVYNRTGRGFPDVSALGVNISTVVNGQLLRNGGTSASAPIFASVISLINEERLHAGKKAIGFLNPTLYKYPEMFNDVTEGLNPGCGTDGFRAVKGWDPVTGMGSPNYEKMKAVFMSLP